MSRNVDLSNMEYGGDVVRTSTLDVNEDDKVQSVTTRKDSEGKIAVHKLPLYYSRNKLIRYYISHLVNMKFNDHKEILEYSKYLINCIFLQP